MPASTRTVSVASLSVVVVGTTVASAHQAAESIRRATNGLNAQLIVVSTTEDPRLVSAVDRAGAELVVAPAGSSRAQMCDLGMGRASGSIVAVRDDFAVGDARWMDTYRSVLPAREAPVRESVVMDTQSVGRAPVADAVPRFASDAVIPPGGVDIATAV